MSLLRKLLYKRIRLVTLTIVVNIFSIVVSLWWNAQLSIIINIINTKDFVSIRAIIIAAITILISMGMAYFLSMCSGWTCETLAHDLRMGYAEHFTALPITEIENLNAGKQLSRLQNEIGDVSSFFHANLFTFSLIYECYQVCAGIVDASNKSKPMLHFCAQNQMTIIYFCIRN